MKIFVHDFLKKQRGEEVEITESDTITFVLNDNTEIKVKHLGDGVEVLKTYASSDVIKISPCAANKVEIR